MEQLLQGIYIPKMVKVKQLFDRQAIADISAAMRQQLAKPDIREAVRPGDRVAIAVGSRGIANLPGIVREIVRAVKERGGKPFIVPAMGSHGGAEAAGQEQILAELGITEGSTGAPVVSGMDVVTVGTTPSGLPVHMDSNAYIHADAIIVTGRIKPHTSFRAAYESGLAKMIAVGLGKQVGAELVHAAGVDNIPFRVEEIAGEALKTGKIIYAAGIVENAYDETCKVEIIPANKIMSEEPRLLEEARLKMPAIRLSRCDVLVVDEMGKNISGSGMDPNIIRRNYSGSIKHEPLAQRIAVLDLTKESHGNANGMTNADVCSRKFYEKISFQATYANPLTNRLAQSVKIPMVMDNDNLAIRAAIKTCFDVDYNRMRVIRINNTLDLEYMEISESLLQEAHEHPQIEVIGSPEPMRFDKSGNVL